jgi:hypothetical protein
MATRFSLTNQTAVQSGAKMTRLFCYLFFVTMIGILSLGAHTDANAAPAPCSLVTTAEVEQVIGKVLGSPRPTRKGSRLMQL